MEPTDSTARTPLTLVTGLDRTASARITLAMHAPGTATVSTDLRNLDSGTVVQVVHRIDADGVDHLSVDDVHLEHGCVSCTLRLSLIPLLQELHRDPSITQIVLALDPALEPEKIAQEIRSRAGDDLAIVDTVCGVDAGSWLTAATGEITLAEAGLSIGEDERTLAQIAVAQIRFADAIVIEGADSAGGAWELARLHSVLIRLAPAAGMRTLNSQQTLDAALLAGLRASETAASPHGRPRRPFDPLLAGQPALEEDCGVALMTFEASRPFHPERLHEALDVLLDGVVASQGRLWIASNPDDILWLESAGEALGIHHVGHWLAARPDGDADPEHRLAAALYWDQTHGDRHSSISVLCHRSTPEAVHAALTAALVTDAEFSRGPDFLADLPSPFGTGHQDPCDDFPVTDRDDRTYSTDNSEGETR
ncbi:ribosome hibernation factor-recruiting GTPase MRF [Gordonia hydrophobica]|uniref:GTP-binding protein n=1 Tax=Gordonia hydrophobica TaxID=40516 RepID=A0ABZ2TVH6_9ACTN|nr:GTP-binding protein [Gordonia hydrophobica]MBM7366046.1 G3E family GTPase [Gordonia hydrophobica]